MAMGVGALVFTALLVVPASTFEFQVNVKSSLHFDASGAKNRPVTKVVTLLEDMKNQMEQEHEEDQEIYEKMACWCETNDKEKTKAIADAEARISDLNTAIETLTATSSRLNTELENLDKEIKKNQEALDQATAIRTKQLAEFNEEEKDMLQSISALKSAIVVLSKHHSAAMIQGAELQVVTTLQHELQKHQSLLAGVLTRSQRNAIEALIQSPDDLLKESQKDGTSTDLLLKDSQKDYWADEDDDKAKKQLALSHIKGAKGKAAPYKPASGEIFGILKQMKESFEENLSQSQKDEIENAKAYEELKAAKEEEIAAGQAQVEAKTQELAVTDEKNAQAKQDLEDTENSLSADEKFLMNLKEKCALSDKEWEERQKERNAEIEAVSKALAILTSDDAKDMFSKTFNFIQTKQTKIRSKNINMASKVLSDAARRLHSPTLQAIALRVRLDAFTKVKQAIDDMIKQLMTDKEDEIKHKDDCVEGFNTNEKETMDEERTKKDLTAKIEDLTMQIDELSKSIEEMKGEIKEMKFQLRRAGEDREKQNKEFQAVVADQRATMKLLEQAMNVLKDFYESAFLLQLKRKQEAAKLHKQGPPPPPGLKEYSKSGGSGAVIQLLANIINDAKAMEAEAIASEEDSQKTYEEMVQDTNKSVEENEKAIVNKEELKAEAEGVKTEKEEELETTMKNLEQLSNTNADLHKDCDFTIKNFDIRQTARDQEVEALKQAKAILSGAKFDAFLQR